MWISTYSLLWLGNQLNYDEQLGHVGDFESPSGSGEHDLGVVDGSCVFFNVEG